MYARLGEFFYFNMNREPKLNNNRQKKIDIVTELTEKFGKAKAVVFTNYQGITHKQLEGFKRSVKPLKAEYVVAKNSLLTIALKENNLKLEEGKELDGQTGTLFLYDDVISPLKALAKTIKELNLPSVKFGIMDKNPITGEQVLKLSTLPTKEVLLGQLVGTLKSPIFGLHRALNWNLQKLVMTLNAIVSVKPALAAATLVASASATSNASPASVTAPVAPVSTSVEEPTVEPSQAVEEKEPESILAESVEEKIEELPETPKEEPKEEVKIPEDTNESSKGANEEQSPKGNNKKPSAQEASGTEGGEN